MLREKTKEVLPLDRDTELLFSAWIATIYTTIRPIVSRAEQLKPNLVYRTTPSSLPATTVVSG